MRINENHIGKGDRHTAADNLICENESGKMVSFTAIETITQFAYCPICGEKVEWSF